MNKAIKLVMTGLLVSANMLAQETDSIQQYGRGISVDWKESTTAGGMVTAGQLSHKTSVNPSNSLFGSVPGLYVLQNAGSSWADRKSTRLNSSHIEESRMPSSA